MSIKKSKYYFKYLKKEEVLFYKDRVLQLFILIFAAAFIISAIKPVSIAYWIYSSTISLLAVLLLVFFYRKMRLTNKSYACILILLILHAAGAHYTYLQCPLGDFISGLSGSSRNNYDRIVNLLFGLLIPFPVVEFIYQRIKVRYIQACILSFLIIMAAGAIYEIQEMFGSMLIYNAADSGRETQKELLMIFVGAALNIGTRIFINARNNRKIHLVRN